MKTLGLTGGIGMGKTAASDLIAQRGIPVIDTDLLARQLVEPGQPALAEIAGAFGNQLLDESGLLRRGELARLVFTNPAARQQLEAILHPRIRQLWLSQLQQWKREGKALGVVVIPLLFETNAEKELDATLCVACSASTQRERLSARGWPVDQIEQRLRAQLPIDQKISRANFVLWNEATLEILSAQLDLVLRRL
jgi:dephospho-CoA kinase